MHPNIRRIILSLLLLTLTLSLLSACAGDTKTSSSTPDAGTVSSDESGSGNENETDILPEVKNLNGRTINIYCFDFGARSDTISGYTGEVLYSTEENATAVDVAKKAVIDQVETQYNCRISGSQEVNVDLFLSTVKNMVMTGTYSYDIIFDSAEHFTPMLNNDLLTDLNTIPTLHLRNSW